MTLENITYDITTSETIVRNYTKEEIKAYEDDRKKNKAINDALNAELEAKAIAKSALLDRLGITADEAKLLLS
jgi:hypothetical protein